MNTAICSNVGVIVFVTAFRNEYSYCLAAIGVLLLCAAMVNSPKHEKREFRKTPFPLDDQPTGVDDGIQEIELGDMQAHDLNRTISV